MERVKTKIRGTLTKKEVETLVHAKDILEDFNYEDDAKDTFHDQIADGVVGNATGWCYLVCFIEELFNNCDVVEEEE